ncbi:MAG TPA: SH3 domain-containing protein [Anaerolineaceae bacterium]
MKSRRWLMPLIIVAILFTVLAMSWPAPVRAGVNPQLPTVSVPTVTGTPVGVTIVVKMDQPQINVRSGPNTTFEAVGVLLAGQEITAKGRTVSGEWVLIDYPGGPGNMGWVYAPLVDVKGGALPVVEPPATPTPAVTNTIDPTLAAQFIVTTQPTRLPTFTAPPPLAIPTFRAASSALSSPIPMGLVIVALAALGAFLGLFSLIQGR